MYFSVSANPVATSVRSIVRAARSRTPMLFLLAPASVRCRRPAEQLKRGGRHHHPQERNWQKDLPSETHELVVAVPRDGALGPAEDEQQHRDLEREPDH